MKKKTIMILGASILQMPAIEKAVEMGLNVIVLDMNPDAIGFTVPGVTQEVISTLDIEQAIKTAKKHKIDGVMTLATDMPVRTVAAVAKSLGLVGISQETALMATDKSIMRMALKNAGVPVPSFFSISEREDYLKEIARFEGPYIVKPADSSGSRGVTLVTKREEPLKAYENAKRYTRNGIVMVEEQMIGPEVSVETLSEDGKVHVIQITDKITTGAPHFVEVGHTQPSRLPEETQEEIKNIAIAANMAIGNTNGPSHTEIIVTDEGPKIVELGARLGGDCITTHLVPLSTGVNMVEACIRIALGEKPNISARYNCGSAIRYFHQHAGVIRDIHGVQKAQLLCGIKQINIVHGAGEKITEITDSGSRVGFVIAQGENADDAAYKCDMALSMIQIDTVDNS